jgi:hypothetical protein
MNGNEQRQNITTSIGQFVYHECLENMRATADQRFKHLTVWIALTGALLYGYAKESGICDLVRAVVMAAAGLVATAAFLLMHSRAVQLHDHYLKQAADLEAGVNVYLCSGRPDQIVLRLPGIRIGYRASGVARTLYALMLVFWIILCVIEFIVGQPVR